MSDPAITYRPAFPDEQPRAASLCQPSASILGDGPQRCFVAMKFQPVERIVGTAFWRHRAAPGTKGPIGFFEWKMVAALEGSASETDFLNAVTGEIISASPGVSKIRTTSWLDPNCPATETLAAAGFKEVASRETFAAKIPAWRMILARLPEENCEASPLGSEHAPEVGKLLSGYGWSENELAHGFETAAGEHPSIFEFGSSAILKQDGRISGVCLARTDPNHTRIHIAALALAGESSPPAGDDSLGNAETAALLRQSLASSSLKEILFERLHHLDSSPSDSRKAIDLLLANYPSTSIERVCRYGKSA